MLPGASHSRRGRTRLAILMAMAAVVVAVIQIGSIGAVTNSGDGLLFYGEGTVTTPRYNLWTNSTSQFGAEATGATAAATIRHTIIKSSPSGDEMIAGVQTTGGVLYIEKWDASTSTWTAEWNVTVGDGNLPRFDIAYEQSSNKVMVVYSSNSTTNELTYRTTNNAGIWQTATAFASSRTNGVVDAVQLEPRSGTNEIGLAYADNLWDLSANFWDGSSWIGEPAAALATDLSRTGAPAACTGSTSCMTNWSFDVAFESTSGELVVGWGIEATSDPRFMKRTAGSGGAWSGTTVTGTTAVEEPTDIELNADPGSNYIGYANITGESTATAASPDLEMGMWTGDTDAYANNNNPDTAAGLVESGTNNVTTGWLYTGSNRVFVVVYDDAAAAVNFYYFDKPGGTWAAGTDFTGATAPAAAQKVLRLRVSPYDPTKAMLVIVDSASDVFTKTLVYSGGTTFTWASEGASNGTAAHELSGSSITGMSADFAYNKFVPPSTYAQSAYRWFGNNAAVANISANTIDTSTNPDSSPQNMKRKIFKDTTNGLYWGFYYNGSIIEYSYSANGTSWTSAGTITGTATADFSIWNEPGSSNVFIAYESSGSVKAQKGTISPTSISWGAATTVTTGGSPIDVNITRDSLGKLWVVEERVSSSTCGGSSGQGLCANRSTNADDVSAWGADVSILTSTATLHGFFPVAAPLSTSGDVYFAYGWENGGTTQVRGKLWDESAGTFGSEQTITTNGSLPSMVATSGDVAHLITQPTTGELNYYRYSGGSWSGATVIDSVLSDNNYSITSDGTTLAAVYADDGGGSWAQIYAAKGTSAGVWGTPAALTSGGSANKDKLTTAYYSSDIVPIEYIDGNNISFVGYSINNGTNVGSALAALNTAATAPAQGTNFRLRMNLHVGGHDLGLADGNFKLQYAGKGAGSCASPSGTPGTYTDVDSTTAIKMADNANVYDGTALTANTNDPTHSSDTLERQTYKEIGLFGNLISGISIGEDGMWDFSLVDNNAAASTTYCFRAVQTSANPGTWSSQTSPADNNWYSVAYGNGTYVAVAWSGSGNRVMTSPDGVTWTSQNASVDNNWVGVTYGNGQFVAVANSGTGNRVMTSPDGVTWTSQDTSGGKDLGWASVTYGGGVYVAVANTGTGSRAMSSTDGVTWTLRTTPADNQWTRVTYGNGKFVAVACGTTACNTTATNRVMTSPNGTTWTGQADAADNQWTDIDYGNGLFVATAISGTGNRIMTSPDGVTWITRPSPADNNWFGLTYGNGLFVSVASTGTDRVMTSPDGITWTIRTGAPANAWNDIIYGNGKFVAVGTTAGTTTHIMTSADTTSNLSTYTVYPEITTAAAAGGGGPTVDEIMRHGNYFSGNAEQNFFWADLGL